METNEVLDTPAESEEFPPAVAEHMLTTGTWMRIAAVTFTISIAIILYFGSIFLSLPEGGSTIFLFFALFGAAFGFACFHLFKCSGKISAYKNNPSEGTLKNALAAKKMVYMSWAIALIASVVITVIMVVAILDAVN